MTITNIINFIVTGIGTILFKFWWVILLIIIYLIGRNKNE